MVQRNGNMLDIKGELMLVEGDHIVMDTQKLIAGANLIDI